MQAVEKVKRKAVRFIAITVVFNAGFAVSFSLWISRAQEQLAPSNKEGILQKHLIIGPFIAVTAARVDHIISLID